MRRVYLDNAATTQLRCEVIDEMTRVLRDHYGNPSSSHAFGREARNEVELARKKIAGLLNCSAQEIIFTSGGTEADNLVLASVVKRNATRIITSRVEHHAVLHTLEKLAQKCDILIEYVRILPSGTVDYDHLEELLENGPGAIVSLMHVNNELGTILDLERTGALCRSHGALFHSDTVQSAGKCRIDLQQTPIDFLAASAHKFHGPKGVGFAFIRKGLGIDPFITGGEQEKGIRAGTESIHNIAGMAKAFELSHEYMEQEHAQVQSLKDYCISQILSAFPGAKINGEHSFYNIVNVCFPFDASKSAMILFALELKGIAVSRGSACQSGSSRVSHVLSQILGADDLAKPSLRISFSHFNTQEDIDLLINALTSVANP